MKLGCNDIGSMDCDYVAEGNTAKEVIDAMFTHASEKHADILTSMSEQEKAGMVEKMQGLIRA